MVNESLKQVYSKVLHQIECSFERNVFLNLDILVFKSKEKDQTTLEGFEGMPIFSRSPDAHLKLSSELAKQSSEEGFHIIFGRSQSLQVLHISSKQPAFIMFYNTPSDKNPSNIDGSSCKKSQNNFAHDQFTVYFMINSLGI